MINVVIDEFSPCLRETESGELVATAVMPITEKNFLKRYNRKSGWYTDWEQLLDNNEIYALVVKGTEEIQGKGHVNAMN